MRSIAARNKAKVGLDMPNIHVESCGNPCTKSTWRLAQEKNMACIIATSTWTVARDEYGSAVRYCCSSVPPSVYVRITLQQSV